MLIGTFRTIPLRNTEEETGYIESELNIEEEVIEKQPDKKGYLNMRIAMHLRGVCERTQTPAEIWDFSPSSTVRKLMNFPESIPFR
ncbi:MAG TPA: hypothetical protein VK181_19505 [Rhizobium sp.]|nr:hypothetical protein [Rhizobium sp.]